MLILVNATVNPNLYLISKAEQIPYPYMAHCSELSCSLTSSLLFLNLQ